MGMCTSVYGHICVWTYLCMDISVYGHICVQTYLCMNIYVYGHICVQTYLCMGEMANFSHRSETAPSGLCFFMFFCCFFLFFCCFLCWNLSKTIDFYKENEPQEKKILDQKKSIFRAIHFFLAFFLDFSWARKPNFLL